MKCYAWSIYVVYINGWVGEGGERVCVRCYIKCCIVSLLLHTESQEVVTTWHNIMAANPNVVKFLSNFVTKG